MAGIMDAVTGFASDNTGNIEKAMIEILDLRNRPVITKEAVKIVGKGSPTSAEMDSFAGAASVTSLMNKGVLSDAMKTIAGLSDKEVLTDEMLQIIAGGKKKYFVVQFNPNTLQISGHSGGYVKKTDYSKGRDRGRSVGYEKGNTTIQMSVRLFFDSCDPQDAFMSDKVNMSPTALATGAAKAIQTGMGKKKTSVQIQVEAFIAALRNQYTRLITFHWGNFTYSGSLRSVRTTYTMFNVTGEPVRAYVDLSIMCADDQELSTASLAIWQARYKQAFGGGSHSFAYQQGTADGLISNKMDSLGSSIGGLFNL